MKSSFSGSGAPPFMGAIESVEEVLVGTVGFRVFAVDPGVITGVAALWCGVNGEILAWAETLITHDELQQVVDLESMVVTLFSHGPVHVAVEDFRVMKVDMSEDFLSPVRIGRRFEWAMKILNDFQSGSALGHGSAPDREHLVWPLRWQMPSRKADYDDERLKVLGFYTPGPDHRRDATRHALVALKGIVKELEEQKRALTQRSRTPRRRRKTLL